MEQPKNSTTQAIIIISRPQDRYSIILGTPDDSYLIATPSELITDKCQYAAVLESKSKHVIIKHKVISMLSSMDKSFDYEINLN